MFCITKEVLWVLGNVWPLPSKTIMPPCRNFNVYLHGKSELHPRLLFFFWDIVKIFETCYVEYFKNVWSSPSIMIVLPCRKLWCPKCWNHLVGKRSCLSACKKSTSSQFLLWDNITTLQTCYLGNFGNAWPSPSKSWYKFEGNFHAYLHATNQLHHFILKILQRNNKLVTLGNLGMAGHTHLKW